MEALLQIGPSSQQHLATHFSVSPGIMSSMTYRLEALGFVQRATNPTDRRADVVSITDKGQKILAGVDDIWQKGDKTIESILGTEESKRFIALANTLSRALGGGSLKSETSDKKNRTRTVASECKFDC
ncbi:MarR family winged helix-turn-helix transcriptional regulator [Citreicella sp. C3M06]|nr:MarR family winged helix-turn-helix transcriptional regulator [Citreicella sp. C3M06]